MKGIAPSMPFSKIIPLARQLERSSADGIREQKVQWQWKIRKEDKHKHCTAINLIERL